MNMSFKLLGCFRLYWHLETARANLAVGCNSVLAIFYTVDSEVQGRCLLAQSI